MKRRYEQVEVSQRAQKIKKAQKIFAAVSISGTQIFQTIAEGREETRDTEMLLPCDLPNFIDWRTEVAMLFADKTSYIEELEKYSKKYRYVYLRPRRFGKSAFLNLLCVYYDIHTANQFNDLFGPLYIGKNPTPSRTPHLVLKFDLSSINVIDSIDTLTQSFNNKVNGVLIDFIENYSKELGYPEVDDLIKTIDAGNSLVNVLVSTFSFATFIIVSLIVNMLLYAEVGWQIWTQPFCWSG